MLVASQTVFRLFPASAIASGAGISKRKVRTLGDNANILVWDY